jgi:putative ABC transport system permease protein
VVAAIWGTHAVATLAPLDLPRRESIAVDWEVAAIVVGVGALLGLLAAMVPAQWVARASLPSLLASGAVRGGGGQGRLRRGLIVTQVALSLVLLASGGLVVRSLEHLLRADPGFKPDGVFTVLVRTPPVFFPQNTQVLAFQDQVEAALAALPGVTGTGATTALPLTATTTLGQATAAPIRIPGAPGNTGDEGRDAVLTDMISVRAGYFEVMGMRIVAGRTFERSQARGAREVVIDATLARRFFPGANPLGAKIPFGPDVSATIVGVVDQARLYDIHQDGRPQIYARAEGVRPLFYTLRTARDPKGLLPEIRAAVRKVDSRVAVGEARTMNEIIGNALRQQRTSAALISAFAFGALLLAAMGLFGVVAGSVARRRHELAVRLAVGADYQQVLRLVLGEAAVLVAIGVLIGVPGCYAAGQLIRGVLVGISPSDPLTLFAVGIGLTGITLVTCYVPARQVLKIDPAQLFREE